MTDTETDEYDTPPPVTQTTWIDDFITWSEPYVDTAYIWVADIAEA